MTKLDSEYQQEYQRTKERITKELERNRYNAAASPEVGRSPFAHLEQAETKERDRMAKALDQLHERNALTEVKRTLGAKAAEELAAKLSLRRAQLSDSTNETLAALGIGLDSQTGSWKDVAPKDRYANVNPIIPATLAETGTTIEIPEDVQVLWNKYNESDTKPHAKAAIASVLTDRGYDTVTDSQNGLLALKKVRVTEIEKFSQAIKDRARAAAEAADANRIDVTGELRGSTTNGSTGHGE